MTVQVDPNVFPNQQGTVTAQLQIQSGQAVNVTPPVRVLINSQQPAQRGTFVDIPGTLVDYPSRSHRESILRSAAGPE